MLFMTNHFLRGLLADCHWRCWRQCQVSCKRGRWAIVRRKSACHRGTWTERLCRWSYPTPDSTSTNWGQNNRRESFI